MKRRRRGGSWRVIYMGRLGEHVMYGRTRDVSGCRWAMERPEDRNNEDRRISRSNDTSD
jgi:hypothetical protein